MTLITYNQEQLDYREQQIEESVDGHPAPDLFPAI
jgi:hypothetical protein